VRERRSVSAWSRLFQSWREMGKHRSNVPRRAVLCGWINGGSDQTRRQGGMKGTMRGACSTVVQPRCCHRVLGVGEKRGGERGNAVVSGQGTFAPFYLGKSGCSGLVSMACLAWPGWSLSTSTSRYRDGDLTDELNSRSTASRARR
jgi:hypothetical protein